VFHRPYRPSIGLLSLALGPIIPACGVGQDRNVDAYGQTEGFEDSTRYLTRASPMANFDGTVPRAVTTRLFVPATNIVENVPSIS